MKTKMLSLVSLAMLGALTTMTAAAALKAGDMAPDFTAPASLAGKTFTASLAELRSQGPVVVYFYPSAYTSGCNAQAHYFAVKMDQFAAAGAKVIGVSLDKIDRLNVFSADPMYCAGKFPVAADPDAKIALTYHLKVDPEEKGFKDSRGIEVGHGFAERTTFVITSDGRIDATIGGMSPTANVDAALAEVKNLAAAAKSKP